LQNIDLVLLLQPLLALAISFGAIVYWWIRRGFRGMVFALSAGAYFIAIAAKYAIQIPTATSVEEYFGKVSVGTGIYFGLQTVFLEVGLAYLFARYAARRWRLQTSDAVPYGLSLSFMENGVLLGIFSIMNLGITYLLLASGTSAASAAYSQAVASEPSLFLPPSALLPLVLIGTLERVSSMLTHIAFGVLCALAAVSGKRKYIAYALPMGLLDALVPFASLNLDLFEVGVFALSVFFVLVAWRAYKDQPPSVPFGSVGG
jgi:hypothetical protein